MTCSKLLNDFFKLMRHIDAENTDDDKVLI